MSAAAANGDGASNVTSDDGAVTGSVGVLAGIGGRLGRRGGMIAPMPTAVIRIVVVKPGDRADAVLAGLAQARHLDALTPDENGVALLRVEDVATGADGWDLVRAEVGDIVPDWADVISIGARPDH
jgi:hypothetical protein